MLPIVRQRLVISASIFLGALAWLLILPLLRPADGATGLTLSSARVGPMVALALVVLAGLPAVIFGLVSASAGHPLAGIFAVTSALGVLAAMGGSTDGWLRSHTDALPASYQPLLIELLVWQALLVVLLMVVQYLRSPLRSRLPALITHDHFGVEMHMRFPGLRAVGAGAVAALAGGALSNFLIQSTLTGQVMISLLVSFMIGGAVAEMAFKQPNPVGILLSPCVVAGVGYAYVLFTYDRPDRFLEAWYAGRLLGVSLALPIHYASAGVAGCCLGVGLAQAMAHDEANDAPSPATTEQSSS